VQNIVYRGEKMKIAIPLFENRISPRLDCAKKALLVNVEEKYKKVVLLKEEDFNIGDTSENIEFYISNKINVVICGGLSIEMQDMLVKHGIRVIPWVTGEAQKALDLFIEGKLASGTMLCSGRRLRRWRFCCQEKIEK
jgi:predicted Fe-Mo cluster-binding NifX family protein